MRVILAIDYSDRSARVIEEVALHQWPTGTFFRVIAAVPRIPPSAAELWFDGGGSLAAVWETRWRRARQLVSRAAEVLDSADLKAETVVLDSLSRRVLRTQSAEWSADRIILGWRRSRL